jgi:S-adenosylmethionine/arginine decarboxylase-like enzyme
MIATRHAEIHGDFADAAATWHRFLVLLNEVPGITILTSLRHDFPGGGFTGVVVIGESHAAIHTWPEHRYAWVELATCGDPRSLDVFVELMGKLSAELPT